MSQSKVGPTLCAEAKRFTFYGSDQSLFVRGKLASFSENFPALCQVKKKCPSMLILQAMVVMLLFGMQWTLGDPEE